MNNRQARIKRINAAFKKAEELMNDGYIVQWDVIPVQNFDWANGLELFHNGSYSTVIYDDGGKYQDLADLTIAEINKELSERLTVWKKVEIRL